MKSPAPSKSSDKKISTKKPSTKEEIKTDYPLSEKDEVKKAEKKLGESQKKNG